MLIEDLPVWLVVAGLAATFFLLAAFLGAAVFLAATFFFTGALSDAVALVPADFLLVNAGNSFDQHRFIGL